MPSQATADAASGTLALYHADGWLDETLNVFKVSAAVPIGLIVVWALMCSQVGLADVFWLGFMILLLPAVGVISFLLRARGQRIVADDEGLRRDTREVPFWMRPFTPSWSCRWQDLLRVDVREIDVRGGRGGPDATIEMRLVLRDGRGIRLRPRYWLTSDGVAEQPTYQHLEALPSVATPLGRALERWAPRVPIQSTA